MTVKKKPVIMVSSTVYGIEELLDRIYTLLSGFCYEVWMSHKGTMPVFSNHSSFENCIKAVERCDLFLGLITPYYGSGKDDDNISISHQELRKAVEINKPRWLLAHDHVVFAYSLLKNLKYLKSGRAVTAPLSVKKTAVIDDLRVIDMYKKKPFSPRNHCVIVRGTGFISFNRMKMLFFSRQLSSRATRRSKSLFVRIYQIWRVSMPRLIGKERDYEY